MNDNTIEIISETLDILAKRVYEESNCKILISYSILDGDILTSGVVQHGEISFSDACKMSINMTHCISDQYGEGEID